MYNRALVKFTSILSGAAAVYFELYSFRLFFMMLAITADTLNEPMYIQNSCRFHLVIMSLFVYAYEIILYLIEYGDQLEEEGIEVWTKKKRRRSRRG